MPHPIFDIFIFLIWMAALLLPGAFLFALRPSADYSLETFMQGVVLTLGALLFTSLCCTWIHLKLFAPTWITLQAAGLFFFWKAKRIPFIKGRLRPERETVGLVVLLCFIGFLRFAPTLAHILPPGWDPSFHLILIKKILRTQTLPSTWEPIETLAVNYPLGIHALIANLSSCSELSPHQIYKLLIPFLGVIQTAQLYAFTLELTSSRRIALYSSAAYGLLAVTGSLDYYRWGGLLNQTAMLFFIEFLRCETLSTEKKTPLRLGFFYACILMTHPHVALIATGVGVLLAIQKRKNSLTAGSINSYGAGLGLGFVLSSPFLAPYGALLASFGESSASRYPEPLFGVTNILTAFGIVFSLLSVAGLLLWVGKKISWRSPDLVKTPLLTLLVLFFGFEYVYRLYSQYRWGVAHVALTPSRFLTDASYFLAIPAGCCIDALQRRFKGSSIRYIGIVLCLALTNYPIWKSLFEHHPGESDLIEAGAWIEEHTSPQTVIATNNYWLPYLAWRPSTLMSLSLVSRNYRGVGERVVTAARLGKAWKEWHLLELQPPSAPTSPSIQWTSKNGWTLRKVL